MISSLSEVYFSIRRFILSVQTKKVISMNYGSRKPWRWVRLDLIFSMRDIYINSNLNPLTKFTRSRRSTELKDTLPWNISQMIMKTITITTRIVISYVMKQGVPLWILWKVNRYWDNNMMRNSQWRESHCRTYTSIRRKKSKREGLWESQSGIWVGQLTIWVKKNYNRVHQVNQFHQNR